MTALSLGLGPSVARRSGFSPLALGSSLLSWWNASAGIGANWTDYKAGRVMTVSGPTWGETSYGGASGWVFDGVNDYMTLESQPFPSGAAPSEMFIVFQQNSLSGDATTRTIVSYGTSGNFGRSVQRLSGNVMRAVCGTGASSPDARDNTNTASSRHVVHGIWTATDVSISVDGNAYQTTSAVPNTGTTRVRIGASLADTPAAFGNMVLSDVLVTGPLTASERVRMFADLLPRRRL